MYELLVFILIYVSNLQPIFIIKIKESWFKMAGAWENSCKGLNFH